MQFNVTFQHLSREHFALLEDWTNRPHVKQWWSEAGDDIESFFVPDRDNEPFIAYVDGQPAAYIQAWRPSPDYEWQKDLAPTCRGIDLFIGPPDMLGRGLGTLIIQRFADKLFAEGATRLVIDPDKRNVRAIAAYRKVGFTAYAEADGDQLMELLPAYKDTFK